MEQIKEGLPARVPAAINWLLAASLTAGILVPIYTDEVAWRIQLSRFALDGWFDRGVGETCGPNTFAVPPLFMWPVRMFSSSVSWLVVDPMGVRLAGIAAAAVAVLLVHRLIRRIARTGEGQWMGPAASALLGLGLLPFLLVWSRPEQPMLLALLLILLIALARPDGKRVSGLSLPASCCWAQ